MTVGFSFLGVTALMLIEFPVVRLTCGGIAIASYLKDDFDKTIGFLVIISVLHWAAPIYRRIVDNFLVWVYKY